MLSILILAVAVAAVTAESHDGGCPDIKPVENFNLTAYQGKWYEISKFLEANEVGGNCGQAEYTLDGDVVKVKNTHVINGVQAFIEGTAKLTDDANKAAKLVVTFKFGDVARESPLTVIATDYNNYAIAYNCKYDDKKKTHQDNAWILSRTQKLEGDAKAAVDAFLKTHSKDLDASKFLQTDFSEQACKYNGTTLITEPAKQ